MRPIFPLAFPKQAWTLPCRSCSRGAAAATAPQGPPWPVRQGHLGTGTEPAALIKSLLSNRALVHALFKTFKAATRLVLSARAEGSAPAGTLRVRGGVLHHPLILPEPSDISEQAHSRQFEGLNMCHVKKQTPPANRSSLRPQGNRQRLLRTSRDPANTQRWLLEGAIHRRGREQLLHHSSVTLCGTSKLIWG